MTNPSRRLPERSIRYLVHLAAAVGGCSGDVLEPDDNASVAEPASTIATSPPITTKAFPPAALATGSLDQGLIQLNRYRALAGLGSVVVDKEASDACLSHLRYLVWEDDQAKTSCKLHHDESNTKNPYYSKQGHTAGMGGLLACANSEGELSLGVAVDRWMSSLYHRIALINPGLTTVGIATYEGYVCLTHASGTKALASPQLVVWPPNGASDVPRVFAGLETPCPTTPNAPLSTAPESCPASGYIVTATWYGSGGYPYAATAASPSLVESATGTRVGLTAWYADGAPGPNPTPGQIPQTVAMVPSTLGGSSRILVTLRGAGASVQWTFRTGTRTR